MTIKVKTHFSTANLGYNCAHVRYNWAQTIGDCFLAEGRKDQSLLSWLEIIDPPPEAPEGKEYFNVMITTASFMRANRERSTCWGPMRTAEQRPLLSVYLANFSPDSSRGAILIVFIITVAEQIKTLRTKRQKTSYKHNKTASHCMK